MLLISPISPFNISPMTLNRNGLFYWIHSTMRSRHTVQPQPKGIASLTIIVWKCLRNSPEKRRSDILCNRHTDQGAIYSSQAFCQAYNYYNILRSLSRVGIPTDNPIIEAFNGWIKEELFLNFDLAYATAVPALLDSYVAFFSNRRRAPFWGL